MQQMLILPAKVPGYHSTHGKALLINSGNWIRRQVLTEYNIFHLPIRTSDKRSLSEGFDGHL